MARGLKRREFLQAIGAGAATLTLSRGVFAQPPAPRSPNFVFILVDDLGWMDLGCYGSSFYKTPNLDRLAASGMRFTNAYAASPVCSPTRVSIMTGKHPARVGITDWIPGLRPKGRRLIGPPIRNEMPLEEVTLAEALKEGGYQTFFAGKWHLGGPGYYPEDQGFDINIGGHALGSPPGGYYSPWKNPRLANGPEGEYLPDRLTDESIRFLHQRNSEQPFLLYLAFYTVHTPIQASKRHVAQYRAAFDKLPVPDNPDDLRERLAWTRKRQDDPDYASMVHAMDENVGRLLDQLDQLKLSDYTVVIFMSDNGGLATLSARWRLAPTCNLPLRAGKGWCYEGGIREPMIIRAPGVTHPGGVCTTPVTSMDFYPTMLELAGLPARPKQHCDGLSLRPLLEGGRTLERDALFWHFPHHHSSDWTPGSAVRVGDWKLIVFYEEERVELYNLKGDPGEHFDLAGEQPAKRDELLKRLRQWQREVGAQLPRPNPEYQDAE